MANISKQTGQVHTASSIGSLASCSILPALRDFGAIQHHHLISAEPDSHAKI